MTLSSALPPDLAWAADPLPRVAGAWPGCGGRLKGSPEDFVVEEIPAYLPEGSGEFLYLWVEKRGLAAEQLVSHLARLLQISHQDIGVAGLKDRHAITRQFVSIPAKCESRLCAIDHPQITLLETGRHRNKLRPGHLKGHRFSIVIRDIEPAGLERARAIVADLATRGGANYFGEQRFGRDFETLRLGWDLLRGTKGPHDIPRARRKFLHRLALSSVQSALFNVWLSDRLGTGRLHQLQVGDVMQVTASGGPFVVEDLDREQPRYAAHETVLAGPIFGPKMKEAQGAARADEERLLDRAGLTRDSFLRYPHLTSGTRRPALVWPTDLAIEEIEASSLRVRFTLPTGCYATVLLRELMGEATAPAAGTDSEESESADAAADE
ncbi:MAG: tRNA pseudouridine(13) synthase TruD [Planctomycetaceae bacterium]